MAYQTTVSVVLAVHNGEEFIQKKLACLCAMDYPRDLIEIVVVSDGSTDATEQIVESFADRRVRLFRMPRSGKSAALNVAFRHASGEILFFTDVRQAIHPDAISHLVANFADASVGAVTGELRIINSDSAGQEADLEVYWRYELWVRRRHSRIDSCFTATGCIYALRRSQAEPIPPDTLTDDAIIPLRAFLRGYRVITEPQAVAFDYPSVAGGEFRRKLRTLAGLWQLHVRLPGFFSRANRMRFHFFSHKSSRLALPWAILLVGVATWALPASPLRSVLLAGELAPVALAVVDWIVPRSWPLKRISSPARTFLAMNAAALLSVSVFVIPARILWRPTRVAAGSVGGDRVRRTH
jgi:cellulose synthase/poly-beta-1,6-N-acetylglucosamine synthase-like glycosyltransferase